MYTIKLETSLKDYYVASLLRFSSQKVFGIAYIVFLVWFSGFIYDNVSFESTSFVESAAMVLFYWAPKFLLALVLIKYIYIHLVWPANLYFNNKKLNGLVQTYIFKKNSFVIDAGEQKTEIKYSLFSKFYFKNGYFFVDREKLKKVLIIPVTEEIKKGLLKFLITTELKSKLVAS